MSGQATVLTKQTQPGTIGKVAAFLFGIAAYLVFFFTFLYAIAFVAGVIVPKTIDSGPVVPLGEAAVINLLLMALFAVQHSVMARRQFKRWNAAPMFCLRAWR
jgi:protein-S-isoprenylcysteine O-methyltransferase Ste14